MSNSNFGHDCRNNIDNCNFEPTFDNIDKMSYIQIYFPLFNDAYQDPSCPDLMTQQIKDDYNKDLMYIVKSDPFADVEWQYARQKRERNIHALKSRRKKMLKTAIKKAGESLCYLITKILINFDCKTSASIYSLAVYKTSVNELTTIFFSEKILMFALANEVCM